VLPTIRAQPTPHFYASLTEVIQRNTSLTTLQKNTFFLMPAENMPALGMTMTGDGSPMLTFMSEPGFHYNYTQSGDLQTWSATVLAESLNTGDALYMQNIHMENPAPQERQSYQLMKVPTPSPLLLQ